MAKRSSDRLPVFAIIPCHACAGNIVVFKEQTNIGVQLFADSAHRSGCKHENKGPQAGLKDSLQDLVSLINKSFDSNAEVDSSVEKSN